VERGVGSGKRKKGKGLFEFGVLEKRDRVMQRKERWQRIRGSRFNSSGMEGLRGKGFRDT